MRSMLQPLVVLAFLAAGPALAGNAPPHTLPDPKLTPGLAESAMNAAKLCAPSFHTGTVRNVGAAEKLQVYRSYGMAKPRTGYCSGPSGCEVDHLISLELGGSNDPRNLWPEPYDGPRNAHDKDKLENALHKLVCTGKLALPDAQHAIAGDWQAAYAKYLGPLK
jgi:hypothetical protein